MAVATGDLYQMTLQMSYIGQTVENVIMMRERTGTSTDAQIKAAAQAFWHSYRQFITHELTLTVILLKRVTPVLFDTLFTTAASGEDQGADSDSGINSILALVSTLRTGVAGKTHRGRVYTPGITNGKLTADGTTLNSTALGQFVSHAADIMNEFDDATGTSATLALGIYSRVLGGTSPYTLAGWQAVSQWVPHSVLGSQRRRRVGVGI